MNTHKFWMKFLMVGALLALLLNAACNTRNAINSPDGQALSNQGDAYMTCLKDKDFQGTYAMMSPRTQRMVDFAKKITANYVDLESVVFEYAPMIAEWRFDSARIYNRNGTTIGSLDGGVRYADGKLGNLSLEFEKFDGTWRVRSSSLEK